MNNFKFFKKERVYYKKITCKRVTMDIIKKVSLITKLTQDFKKKRIILDESKKNFGFDTFLQLKDVDNKDEVKGYPFKLCNDSQTIKFGLKVICIDTSFNKNQHPCQLEILYLKFLTKYLTTLTPHIVPYIHSQKISNNCVALKRLHLKQLEKRDMIKSSSLLLVSEFIEGGSLDKWVYRRYQANKDITDIEWKYIIFSLIYTLHVLQLNFKLNHNDCHYGNILVDESEKSGVYYVYKVNGKQYYFKNQNILCMFWDLEFGNCYNKSIPNSYPNLLILSNTYVDRKSGLNVENNDKKTVNIPINYNEVYDVHYLLGSFLDICQSDNVCNWIEDFYPAELIDFVDPYSSSNKSSSLSLELSKLNLNDSESKGSNSETETESSNSESDSESESESDSDSESSNSESESESESESDSETDEKSIYIEEGRLINGVEKLYNLPNPLKVLESGFFDEFLIKPNDFNKETAIYFNESI
jgi:hypothetical protein